MAQVAPHDHGHGDNHNSLGLHRDLEIDSQTNVRTPYTPQSDVPVFYSLVTFTDEVVEVTGQMVFPFPAKDCFALMTDYAHFLKMHLKGNERDAEGNPRYKDFNAKPVYLKGNGGVGSLIEYAYDEQDIVYWMVDKVTTLDAGSTKDHNGNPVYRFGMETQNDLSKPRLSMKDHGTHMTFTTFIDTAHKQPKGVKKGKVPNPNDSNEHCHLKWVRHYKKPVLKGSGGTISLNRSFYNSFDAYMQHDLIALWEYYMSVYSKKLPKSDSKVCIIGAGPSGLHMAYLLANKGLNPKNITILEKDNRYGGKTLSIADKTNKQLADPKFNPPPPKGLSEVSKVHSKWETVKDVLNLFLTGGLANLNKGEVDNIKRNNTPNALLPHESGNDWEYFINGENVHHELGTCYLSPGYYAIRTLLKEVQDKVAQKAKRGNQKDRAKWEALRKDDITREVGPDTYAIQSATFPPNVDKYTLDEWVFHSGKEYTKLDEILFCCPEVGVDASVLGAKLKYCRFHEEYLGQYYYTLPPRPSETKMKDLVMPFGEFLAKKDLETLVPLFTYALTAQGYGIVSETPTFLAMQWLTPDLLDGYFEWNAFFGLYKNSVGEPVRQIPKSIEKFNNYRKGMLVSGWGALWDRIVALYDLDSNIVYNVDVTSIKRNCSEGLSTRNGRKPKDILVQYKKNNAGANSEITTAEFDYLVVACPLIDPADPNGPTKPLLPLDFTQEERRLFLTSDLKAGIFRTTLFHPQKNGPFEKDHLRIFLDEIQGEESGKGKIFGVRDSYKAIQPRLSTVNGDKWDPTKFYNCNAAITDSDGHEIRAVVAREKMCYQYVSPAQAQKISEPELQKNFAEFITRNTDYVENTSTEVVNKVKLHEKAWTYYTHYEGEGLLTGKLWDILEMQGLNKTLFVHASTNFESVLDIVNYNNMLWDGLTGKLDSLVKPEADTRPDPWQRPQQYLMNAATLRKVVRHTLNFFITIFWFVYYCLSWPFAEFIYLRFQRYQLQVAFQTQDLGSPWEYNMRKFINVSPTTRGYVNYIKGLDNGIPKTEAELQAWDHTKYDPKVGPGDGVFKILQDPKSGFREKYPYIPTSEDIECSIQWNMTDFRVGVRYWLTTFTNTFQPLLTPTVQNIINIFGYFLPNYYSWFVSWVFASQFRLLIGFSYRFEDERGGGLYIPDCNMLRTAIKEHGIEGGQKICLTVCKLFTEEVMRQKKMMIDFEPNFITGKGYGCTVRMYNPKEHAFSDHSTYKFRTEAEQKRFDKVDYTW